MADQDVEMEQQRIGTAALARAGGGPGNTPSKETPISPYPNLSYGLQETHTTVLPWVGWLSVAVDKSTHEPIQLKIRMNTPYDMLDVTMQSEPAAGAAYSTPGFYAHPSGIQTSGADAGKGGKGPSGVTYPRQFTAATTQATEKPAWRDFWGSLYDYYTVLGCEYEITIHNPNTEPGADMLVIQQYDTYSDSAGGDGEG